MRRGSGIGRALLAGVTFFAQAGAGAEATWTRHNAATEASSEKGVRVFRGPQQAAANDVEAALAGGDAKNVTVRIVRETLVVNCFRPRRLTVHGFQGVRRYNTGFGGFRNSTFGFNDYDRDQLTNC
ncbi:MAG: hypothetical protein AAFX08_02330 [Pseudomonadota bacterium]